MVTFPVDNIKVVNGIYYNIGNLSCVVHVRIYEYC